MPPSNIEAAARAVAESICHCHPRAGEDQADWIDRHWEAIAAEMEAGLIDDRGEPLPGYTAEKGLAAIYEWCVRRFT